MLLYHNNTDYCLKISKVNFGSEKQNNEEKMYQNLGSWHIHHLVVK